MARHPTLAALLVLGACDEPDPGFVDAGPIDGALSLATVTVHVRSVHGDGAADPTATVFFVDADGRLAGEVQPDASGTATGTLTVGGGVTVGWAGPPVVLTTILAVEDGDDLTVGPDDTAYDQELTVTLPVRTGANLYNVSGPCMDGTSGLSNTFTVRFSRACGPTHPLVARSRVGNGDFAYVSVPAVTPVAGGELTVTGAWVAATSATVELSGLSGTDGVYPYRQVQLGGASVDFAGASNLPIVDGVVTATFRAPPADVGEGTELEVSHRPAGAEAGHRIHLRRPTLTEPAPVDVTPTLPDIATRDQSGDTVSWTLNGAGAFDGTVIDLEDIDGSEVVLSTWRVIAPPTATAATLPALPAPFDRSSIPLRTVQLIEASVIDGYAGFRRRAAIGAWVDAPPVPAPADARLEIRVR